MKCASVLIPLFLVLFFSGCVEQSQKAEVAQGWKEIPLQYAKEWKVYEKEDRIKIVIVRPYKGATDSITYVLQKNSEKARQEKGGVVISVPVQQLICTSTTHLPALEMLGKGSVLKGFPSTQFISSPYFNAQIEKGDLVDLGVDYQMNIEKALSLSPDLVIGYTVNGDLKAYNLLEKSGIPVLLNSDYLEASPLGRAEWIKLFGYLTGEEKKADSIFREIEKNYLRIKKLGQSQPERPTLFSGTEYKGTWFMPAGESWAAALFEDAGSNYLWKESQGVGSLELSFETVFADAANADFWIGASTFDDLKSFYATNAHYQDFEAFEKQMVFSSNKRDNKKGGNDYYEKGFARPDIVLRDIVKIVHPTTLPQDSLYFFQQLH